ncbi:MAG: photosystem I assembly protein Ycf3 [Syntrophaceae bacterium PtaU1.Bin231]|nr:MAG: photosystem I assembly protein Ycf3 [Syntrophaceae bacterium PtaU1.Bin231]
MRKFVLLASSALLLALMPCPAPCQTASLEEGVRQYKAENYEEAIEILLKVRKADPSSSMAAFFLGMAFKQTNDVQNALPQFRDAVMLNPPIREAVVELIDISQQSGNIPEAKQWIGLAERENILPAKVSFLKGMVLAQEGKYGEAIESFEKSKKLDAAYTQAAEFQIALCYMNQRNFSKAKERFQAALTLDPLSDLGSFARRYQEIVEQRSFIERPLRITLGVMGKYDTNMLAEPNLYPGIESLTTGDQASYGMTNTFRLDYVPTLSGNWLFNATYALASGINERNYDTHDVLANTISLAPGYNFGKFALNFPVNYTHTLKRDPGYRRYADNFSAGPMVRYLAAQSHILELFAGYTKKNVFKTVTNPELEDQSSCGVDSYLSWMWLLEGGGIFNLKYGHAIERADGIHYSNQSNRFTVNAIYPIYSALRLQLSGDVNLQNYDNENSFFGNETRRDKIYTGTAGLTWDVHRNVSLIAQYTGIVAHSNIAAYDYDRSIYSAGMELKF